MIAADAWLMTHAETAEDWKLNARLAMPLLEGVLKRDPDYTPAIHFYIHATEMAGRSGACRALCRPAGGARAQGEPPRPYAEPHLLLGRPLRRRGEDEHARGRARHRQCQAARTCRRRTASGACPIMSHNVTFGLGGAIEAGDADIALRLGRPLVAMAQAKPKAAPFMQMIAANGYYAMARFADPAEVLALPEPKLPFLQAAWHYARGEAFARRNDAAGVRNGSGRDPRHCGRAQQGRWIGPGAGDDLHRAQRADRPGGDDGASATGGGDGFRSSGGASGKRRFHVRVRPARLGAIRCAAISPPRCSRKGIGRGAARGRGGAEVSAEGPRFACPARKA